VARYRDRSRVQGMMMPINLEDQLVPGTFEHTVDYLVDNEIDLSVFESRYSNDQMSSLIHGELPDTVLGAAFAVHNVLGPGLLESAYEGAICVELKHRALWSGRWGIRFRIAGSTWGRTPRGPGGGGCHHSGAEVREGADGGHGRADHQLPEAFRSAGGVSAELPQYSGGVEEVCAWGYMRMQFEYVTAAGQRRAPWGISGEHTCAASRHAVFCRWLHSHRTASGKSGAVHIVDEQDATANRHAALWHGHDAQGGQRSASFLCYCC
jgi:hypothetical protein